jgi:AbiTii
MAYMNSLITELQANILDHSILISDLLRKALLVAHKLEVNEFIEWIELELKGYGDQPLPEYRLTQGKIPAFEDYNWQFIIDNCPDILAGFDELCVCKIGQPISEIIALIDSGEKKLIIHFNHQAESILNSLVGCKVQVFVSTASIKKIPDAVRDTVLRWTLKLESDGITGEGMTFSPQEKEIAKSIDYGYLIQININSSQMQTSSSKNQSISESINNDLREANITNFANQIQDSGKQIASNFSQNINQNIDEITTLIESLRKIVQDLPEEQREEAIIHLDDLQEDINAPEKQKPKRLKTRILALLAVGSVIAGATDFTNNVMQLSEKLGVNIPQIITHHPVPNLK